jgi:hypothetical protein
MGKGCIELYKVRSAISAMFVAPEKGVVLRDVVIVCAWEEGGSVGHVGLQAADTDLHAGWTELVSAEHHNW